MLSLKVNISNCFTFTIKSYFLSWVSETGLSLLYVPDTWYSYEYFDFRQKAKTIIREFQKSEVVPISSQGENRLRGKAYRRSLQRSWAK